MAYSKQHGPCAFTAACSIPGPRIALARTNLTFCPVHARTMQIGESQSAHSTEFSATAFHAPRSTSRRRANAWMAGVGV